MRKEKDNKKRGCWWRCLIIIAMLLLAVGVMFLMSFLNNRNSVDTKFQQLVNQEFSKTAFTDNVNISKWQEEFASKLRTATGNNAICSDAGEINFETLDSSAGLVNNWTLSRYDFAIYCSQRNKQAVLSDDNLDILLNKATINRISWTISGQELTYSIVYQFKGGDIAMIVTMSNVPDKIYLTAEATIDLTALEPVKMYNYTINKLTGDDNEYCLKKIFSENAYTEKMKKQLAYKPFSYLEELNKLWNTRLALKNDSIIIAK